MLSVAVLTLLVAIVWKKIEKYRNRPTVVSQRDVQNSSELASLRGELHKALAMIASIRTNQVPAKSTSTPAVIMEAPAPAIATALAPAPASAPAPTPTPPPAPAQNLAPGTNVISTFTPATTNLTGFSSFIQNGGTLGIVNPTINVNVGITNIIARESAVPVAPPIVITNTVITVVTNTVTVTAPESASATPRAQQGSAVNYDNQRSWAERSYLSGGRSVWDGQKHSSYEMAYPELATQPAIVQAPATTTVGYTSYSVPAQTASYGYTSYSVPAQTASYGYTSYSVAPATRTYEYSSYSTPFVSYQTPFRTVVIGSGGGNHHSGGHRGRR